MNAPDELMSLPELANDGAVAAVVSDDGGRIVRATSTAAELLGMSAAKMAGVRLIDLAADGWTGAAENAFLRMRSGSVDPFEVLLLGRSGRRTLVRMIPWRTQQVAGSRAFVLFWQRLSFAAESPPKAAHALSQRLSYGLLRRHDEHRGRIARELHHDVASLVTVAKLAVENAAGHLQRGQTQEVAALLSNTADWLRETLANVRRISAELVPSTLEDLGLVATVEWLSRQIRESHPDLRIDLQLDVDESLISPTLKVDLFRIIEEALFNAARHARASRVGVTLLASRTQIRLNIEDDGYGFDAALRRHGDRDFMGVGLHSIGSRIDATNGSLQLESMPGAGTSIVATWPTDG